MLRQSRRPTCWLVAATLLAAGCARPAFRIRGPLPTVEQIASRIRENGSGLRDFEGRASISISTDGVRHGMKAVVLFKRPDSLRMEMTGFMGMNLATMAIHDGSLRIYLPMLNRVIEGSSDSSRLRRLAGVPFDLCDLKDILFGTGLLSDLWGSGTGSVGIRDGQYVITTTASDRVSKVWVDAGRLLVLKEEILDAEGNLLMRRSYSRYQEDDGVLIPRTIQITRGDQEVGIRFTAFDINSGLASSRFEMVVPADAVRVPL